MNILLLWLFVHFVQVLLYNLELLDVILFNIYKLFIVIIKFIVPKNNNGKTMTVYNIFFWTSLMFGNSLLLSLYVAEWYATKNCPLPQVIFLYFNYNFRIQVN